MSRDAPSGHDGLSDAGASQVTGIAFKVASVTAFIIMASLIKASGRLPPGQIVFFRSFFAILPVVAWLAWRGQLKGALRTSRPFGHVYRGMIGVTAMGLGFFGLTRLPLPDATALHYANPLIVVVLSALFMGEVVRIYRWSAVLAGFVGVLIISWPKLSLFNGGEALGNDQMLGVLATLAGAACAAGAMIQVRNLVKSEKTATIVLWFSLTSSAAGLATWVFGWDALSARQVALLVTAGFFGGIGQILLTQSYRHADMSTIAPFEYTSMIFAIAIGFFAFAEIPTAWTITGAAIVISSGIFIIMREHRLGLERKAARKVTTPS